MRSPSLAWTKCQVTMSFVRFIGSNIVANPLRSVLPPNEPTLRACVRPPIMFNGISRPGDSSSDLRGIGKPSTTTGLSNSPCQHSPLVVSESPLPSCSFTPILHMYVVSSYVTWPIWIPPMNGLLYAICCWNGDERRADASHANCSPISAMQAAVPWASTQTVVDDSGFSEWLYDTVRLEPLSKVTTVQMRCKHL